MENIVPFLKWKIFVRQSIFLFIVIYTFILFFENENKIVVEL